MPAGIDLLFQLVEFALLAAAEFFLDCLDLLVEVVLFLRALHLPLDTALDGAIDVQFLNLNVEQVGHAGESINRIEDLEQFLFLFDGQLQIGPDCVGELAGIVHANRGDHGLVVQILAELDVLFEEIGYTSGEGFELGTRLDFVGDRFNDGAKIAFFLADGDNFSALDAFDQNFDVPIGLFEALHDVGHRADRVNLFGTGLVD